MAAIMMRIETPASTTKIRRQEPKDRISAPSAGAISGATPNTTETAESCRRASRPSNRSRIIARGRMPIAPAPAPCTRRNASSAWIEGARAEPAAHSVNRARPIVMIALRPNRSANGPTTIGALEKPAMKIAIVDAASVCGA